MRQCHFISTVFALCALPFSLSAATLLVTGTADPGISGQQLQSAVDSAQPGDTILVSPNVYRGTINLPKKNNPNGLPITIQSSSSASSLPGVGVRTSPTYSVALPQIVGDNGQSPIFVPPGASHYNLINLEMRPESPAAFIFQALTIGSGNSDQSTLDAVPRFITVDRCYIHGFPGQNLKSGIQLNSGNTKVINNYIAEIHSDYQDSVAITGFNGPGPFEIVNNYLEAAGVNVIFGGAVPLIPGLIPSNILIAKNDFAKLLSYKNWDLVDAQIYAYISQTQPNRIVYYQGRRMTNFVYHTVGAYTPIVKNMLEFKLGQDVSVIGNTFTNTYVQADQFGIPLVITPRTEQGQVPWATTQRINISDNIFRHQGGVISILDKEMGQTGPATNNITLYNNLFEDLRSDYSFDYERLISVYGITNLRIDHNTMLNNAEYFTEVSTTPVTNFIYTDNIAVYGAGFSAQCGGYNVSAFACGFVGYSWSQNLLIGGNANVVPDSVVPYTYFPPSVADVGFVNAQAIGADYHNYALAPTSLYKGKGLHRSDPGFMPGAYDAARNSY